MVTVLSQPHMMVPVHTEPGRAAGLFWYRYQYWPQHIIYPRGSPLTDTTPWLDSHDIEVFTSDEALGHCYVGPIRQTDEPCAP